MKVPFRTDGETVMLIIFALAVLASCVAVVVEEKAKAEAVARFEICPLCGK
jgi:hypothetical protein